MYLEKDKTRAQTRFNLQKKKIACSKYFWLTYIDDQSEENLIKKVGKLSHNPKNCSCWMCGNPRRKYKGRKKGRITLKEEIITSKHEIENYLKYEEI